MKRKTKTPKKPKRPVGRPPTDHHRQGIYFREDEWAIVKRIRRWYWDRSVSRIVVRALKMMDMDPETRAQLQKIKRLYGLSEAAALHKALCDVEKVAQAQHNGRNATSALYPKR